MNLKLEPLNLCLTLMNGGYAVAQLVEALRYKPEGRGFDQSASSSKCMRSLYYCAA
jgi:hypothetical protein